ncbi:MAG: hypothetical protein NVSMB9_13460 [Isosphaeraceae bacterium]
MISPRLEILEGRELLATLAFAQGVGAAGQFASAEAVAVDSLGNSYVTGSFRGTVNFGGTTLTSAGSADIFVEKLNSTGGVVWADRMGSSSATKGDFGRGIALDALGNVYVTGILGGPADFGPFTVNNAGGQDVFVTKLNNAGTFLWANSYGGTGNDQGQSIAVDTSGNVYTTGGFQGTANFGSQTLTTSGAQGIFVMKQDTAGNVVWAKSMGGPDLSDPQGQSGFGVALDGSGNVYTTGVFTGTASFGGVSLTSAGLTDSFVAKMDNAGNVLWAKQFGGSGHDDGTAIAVDPSGNVFATGDFVGTGNFGGVALTSAGQNDAYVIRLNSVDGSVAWAKSYGGSGADAGFGIALDSSGGLYTTGVFQGNVNFGAFPLTSSGGYDVYFAKLDPATGNIALAQSFGSVASEQSYQIAVGGPSNNITLVGTYGGTFYGLPTDGSAYVLQFRQGAGPKFEPPADFLALGKTQLTVFRPGNSLWIIHGPSGDVYKDPFGAPNLFDIPVPGDYNGVGHAQLAVFRPSTSQWIIHGDDGVDQYKDPFGARNLFDIPVPGDYDGVGHTQLAVFRPSTSQWIIRGDNGVDEYRDPFGARNLFDIPAPGDYDGVGHTQLAVFRPSTSQWIIHGDNGVDEYRDPFGARNLFDIPVPGDYDGVGRTQLAVFRPSTSQWIVRGVDGTDEYKDYFGARNLVDLPVVASIASLKKLGLVPAGSRSLQSMSVPASSSSLFVDSSLLPGSSVSSSSSNASAKAPTVVSSAPPLGTIPEAGVRITPRPMVVVNQAASTNPSPKKDLWSTALDHLFADSILDGETVRRGAAPLAR